MNVNPEHNQETQAPPQSESAQNAEELAYLEQALWKQLAQASTSRAFGRAWLTLQCAMIDGIKQGLLLLGDEAGSTVRAQWPESDEQAPEALVRTAELARSRKRGLVRVAEAHEPGGEAGDQYVAYPFVLDDRLYGLVALRIEQQEPVQLRKIMRQLQWGAAWLEVQQRRAAPQVASAPRQRLVTVIQQVATALEHSGFQSSATAVATEIALAMDCERVCIGFMQGTHVRVEAFSHSAQFDRKSNLVRAIGNAMDEAIGQADTVVFAPSEDSTGSLNSAHALLSEAHHSHCICTAPFTEDGDVLGAITFERSVAKPFSSDDVQLCQHLASVIGPILVLKRRDDQWLGLKAFDAGKRQWQRLVSAGYAGRKIAVACMVAVVAFFAVVDAEYRVGADASLEGSIQRVIAAPMDGYIGDVQARAGDIVNEGDLLVSLDDSDLRLEQTKWRSQKNQLERQRRDALSQHDRAQTRILKAQWDQASAELQLLDKQLAKTEMRAPFDGIVVSGDLSQSLGAPVQRGQVLMEVAPLEKYRVVLAVDEREISYVAEGQTGDLVLPSLPGERFRFVVNKITPVATAEGGANTFRIEGELLESGDSLRPGMEGAGKIAVGERKLIWIWTHNFTEWLRIWVWSWWY